jgi:hypothetical protein
MQFSFVRMESGGNRRKVWIFHHRSRRQLVDREPINLPFEARRRQRVDTSVC